ncbi:hypothetical protein DVT68_01145 [Dyella solisilvae]|uniref:Outer membrane protein beta-barrel domain-containing protein n=1 Tax=Dyella solisilvae TaxID=1920168 RepID=A0A370KA19_9GAMM|nr:hypothetical protein [Dyella solisilvae]RDI99496.1 hypothetical protein DVT68_01145 [Dyella solisilvae]
MRRAAFLQSKVSRVSLAIALAAAFSAPTAKAEQPDLWDGNWHYSIEPYIWLPGISAETRYQLPNNGGQVQQKSTGNIFSNLSGAFMLDGSVRKDNWGFYGDIDWVNFTNEKGRFSQIGGERFGAGANLDTSWDLKGGMINLAGLYSMAHSNQGYIDLVFGMRYLWIKGNLDWNLTVNGNAGNLNIDRTGSLRNSTNATDGIIGIRGRWTPFENQRWFLPYYLDLGAGTSNTTYQVRFGVGYAFNWGDIGLNYRDVGYNQSGSRFLKSLQLSGPTFSVNWNF